MSEIDFEVDLFGETEDLESIHEDANNEEEAEEVKDGAEAAKVETTRKRIIKNPQPKLNADRLRGPRGLATLEKIFQNVKFKGKGHEAEYLDKVMWSLEHWCHRLYPKLQFDECLYKIEKLGNKKVVRTYMNKIRQGIVEVDDVERGEDLREDFPVGEEDEFDNLLDEQIAHIQRDEPVMEQREVSQRVPEELDPAVMEKIQKNREEAMRKLAERKLAQQMQLAEYEKIDAVPEDLAEDEKKKQEEVQERIRRNREEALRRLEARKLAQSQNVSQKEDMEIPDGTSEANIESTEPISFAEENTIQLD